MVKSPTFCNGLHCQECDVYDAYISSSLSHRSGVTPVVITDSCSSAAISHCLLVCFSQCDTQDSVNNSSRTAGTCAARSPPPHHTTPHHHPFTDFFLFYSIRDTLIQQTSSSTSSFYSSGECGSVRHTFIFDVSLEH